MMIFDDILFRCVLSKLYKVYHVDERIDIDLISVLWLVDR